LLLSDGDTITERQDHDSHKQTRGGEQAADKSAASHVDGHDSCLSQAEHAAEGEERTCCACHDRRAYDAGGAGAA
jgi:hypothetical protein